METNSDPLRKIPTKHAPDIKTDIGTSLKAARTKKGSSLDAAGQHTRIPKKFLDALEGNRFDEFPALAYLRGFLKSYCDYLEIDFDPLWRQIVPEPPPPAVDAAPSIPASGKERPASSPISIARALGLAGAVAVLIGLFLFRSRQTSPTAVQRQEPMPPAALQPIKPPSEPQLTILFRRDMWVSVTADGVEKFQGRVPQGSKQEWKAKRTLLLRSSDPQNMKLTLNEAPFTLPAPDADGTFRIEAP